MSHLTADIHALLQRRDKMLDVLRALAVFLVLLTHFEYLHGREALGPAGQRMVAAFMNNGWMGVDLFFVLSGFLISGLLYREYQKGKRLDIVRFYIRRGLKIYPPFYALLAVTVGVFAWQGRDLPLRSVVAETFFIQNYLPGLWGHTWTLAIEEHFYFLLPGLLLLLARRQPGSDNPFRAIPWLFALMAISLLGVRYLTLRNEQPPYLHSYMWSHCRMDSLMCGVVISYFWHFHNEQVRRWVARHTWTLVGLGLLFLLAAKGPRSNWWMHLGGYSMIWAAFGCLVAVVCCRDHHTWGRHPLIRPLAYCGQYSYSIYLWHLPVVVWSQDLLAAAGWTLGFWARGAVYMVGSLVVGIVSARLVEMPVLALRDRLFPSRIGNVQSTP